MTLDDARLILAEVIDARNALLWRGWTPTRQSTRFPYICFWPGPTQYVVLDGEYSPDQLEAIAVWMRAHTDRTV